MTDNSSPSQEENSQNDDLSFAQLFEEYVEHHDPKAGSIVEGHIIRVSGDQVLIDVGLKAEGWVDIREFAQDGNDKPLINEGDTYDIYIERLQNKDGMAVLSREKACRELAWSDLEKKFEAGNKIEGFILSRVKGGYTVNVEGAIAFLPGSQVDIRPARDITPLLKTSQPFQILKMDRQRGNIVVSRRAIMEDARDEKREELFKTLEEGMIVDGVVKNITHYGIFVDLGGIDGLVHITDMAWNRVGHPSELVNIGDTIKVQVIRFSRDTQRISLGMKQLDKDPWEDIEDRYPQDTNFDAKVNNITEYGAFVELEEGIEGLVHVSEMSWSKRNLVASKFLEKGQTVTVRVLDINIPKRRISLGMKQCTPNPWEAFKASHPTGTQITGKIKTITEFGLFIGLTEDIDGMAHVSHLGGDKNNSDDILSAYKKDDEVTMEILDVDPEKERVSLGLHQVARKDDAAHKVGEVVTCLVNEVGENGLVVSIGDDVEGYIPRSELAIDPSEQRLTRFAVGEKLDAQVTRVERSSGKLTLSIRKYEREEERAAVKAYGSTDSGASLGDILGVQLSAFKQQPSESDPEEETPVETQDSESPEAETPVETQSDEAVDSESSEEETPVETQSDEVIESESSEEETPVETQSDEATDSESPEEETQNEPEDNPDEEEVNDKEDPTS